MGCTQSKIENEEAVHRCKERKDYMGRAVMARNKFASAHSATAVSLKNTGAALSDFAQGEVVVAPSVGVAANTAPSYESFIRPPPPLPPSFSITSSPLHQAAATPGLEMPRHENHHVEPIMEEDEEEDDEEEHDHDDDDDSIDNDEMESDHGLKKTNFKIRNEQKAPPPMPENKGESWDFFFNVEPQNRRLEVVDVKSIRREVDRESDKAPPETVKEFPPQVPPEANVAAPKVVKRVKVVVPVEAKRSNLNLVQIFTELDDCFLKASESAHEVSRLLEATRLHYHSNFADKRGNGSWLVMDLV